MALTSCGAAAKPVEKNIFLEDTTAHSEVFGGQDIVGGQLQIRNRAKGESISAPKIGYQIKYEDGKLAVRFIAAIKDLNVNAYWRRGAAAPDGSELRDKSFNDAAKPATKYYTSLSADGSVIEAGVGDYEDYVGFVVFSVYNIPYNATNKEAYLAAYVNLTADENGEDNGAGGTYDLHNNSLGLAVKLERKTETAGEDELMNAFAFDPTVTGHFLEGTINGSLYNGGANGLYRESDPARKGDNFAWYENVPLKETDSFGSFYYEHDKIFQFFGNSTYFAESVNFFAESSLDSFNQPLKSGHYNLYVSAGVANHVFTSVVSFEDKVTLWLEASSKWLELAWDTNPRFAVYLFNDTQNEWIDMVHVEGNIYKTADAAVDTTKYSGFIFGRMKPTSVDSSNSWSSCMNQTGNHYVSEFLGFENCMHKSNDEWGDDHKNDENDTSDTDHFVLHS